VTAVEIGLMALSAVFSALSGIGGAYIGIKIFMVVTELRLTTVEREQEDAKKRVYRYAEMTNRHEWEIEQLKREAAG
jgi:hypothetical protein